MDNNTALARLEEIINGIDREDLEPGGWWETSQGVEFGSRVKADLIALVSELESELSVQKALVRFHTKLAEVKSQDRGVEP